jgi:hypothetical protein
MSDTTPSTTMTPAQCFEQLKPGLAELARAIRTAPCNQAGLALLVAAYAFTLAAKTMGKDQFANAREVADLIVEAVRPEAPKLRAVT